MIINKIDRINKYFLIIDVFITVVLFFLVHFFINIFFLNHSFSLSLSRFTRIPWLIPMIIFLWSILLNSFYSYPKAETLSIKQLILPIFKTILIGGSILALLLYLTRSHIQSRLIFLLFISLNFITLVISRILLLIFRRKLYQVSILLIEDSEHNRKFERYIRHNKNLGLKLNKIIQLQEKNNLLKEIKKISETLKFDWVIFSIDFCKKNLVENSIYFLEEIGIPVSIIIEPFFKPEISWFKLEEYINQPMFTFYTTTGRVWGLIIKNFIDKILSIISILSLSPFLLLISVIIKSTSKGSVLFKQERCGLNGKVFKMFKFRTMNEGSEKDKKKYLKKNIIIGNAFKIKNDPRVTKFGKFLRRWSLDELPQLFNILKGDMSFVGPRPPTPEEVNNYQNWQRRKLSMKPGLTCYWQIEGRNTIKDFNQWIKLDLKYIDNWSLFIDLRILLITIPVIINGQGAY